MNDSQKKKLLKAKTLAKQETEEVELGYFSDQQIKSIHSDIDTIKGALAEALTYERDDLIESQKESLERIDATLKEFASRLQDSLDQHETKPVTILTPELAEAVKQLTVIAHHEPVQPKDVDFPEWLASDKGLEEVTKALDSLSKAVSVKPGQLPGDFVPMRRVVRVGNKMMFDDSFYTGGGGGSSIPTKNGSVPVVNPDGSNIGGSGTVTNDGTFATPARQDTGNTSLAGIKTQTDKLTFTGNRLQVEASVVVESVEIGTVDQGTGGSSAWKVDGSATTQPISAATLPLPSGAATSVNQTTELTRLGDVTETAPTTDTASSGLNGRLQRIAQRITSLITALGSPFQAGGSIGNTAFGVNNGSGASAVNIQDGGNSITVDGAVTITPSGTQDENLKQVNGATVNVGTGTASTGTQRVAVSSDSFPASQAVTGTFFQATQPVSLATNTPTLQSGSTTTVTQATGTNLHTVVDSGTITAVTGITNALPTGTNVIGKVGIDQTTPGTTNKVDIADSLNNSISAFPATFLRTTDEPHQLLYDPFDGVLDTTNTWTVTTGNSAVAATSSAGIMSMGTGTTASGWSKLVSQPSFRPTVPAWIGYSFLNKIPDLASPTANVTRFFGSGTPSTTPTITAVMTDGIGFELVDTKMFAVYYAGGVRTVIQDLSAATGNAKQPTDSSGHRYIIYIRTDKVYFYIDGLTSAQLVATGDFTYPNVQTAPMTFVAVGGATPPGANTQITSVGATVWDTGKNNVAISDPTYPWRRQTIDSNGAGKVKESQPSASAVTSVANSVTNVTLLASNANRRQATIYNDDTLSTGATLKLKLGATASATSFTIPIAPGGYYELPQPVYTGIIDGIASAATGNARITELS